MYALDAVRFATFLHPKYLQTVETDTWVAGEAAASSAELR